MQVWSAWIEQVALTTIKFDSVRSAVEKFVPRQTDEDSVGIE